ncbi:MAG: fimbrillin family protein [Muribaculaceae bacterium]|nr:fimbrillin family protein [Muribaculaceae bacterium]
MKHSTIHIDSRFLNLIFSGSAALLYGISLCSCTDDTLQNNNESSQFISFGVSESIPTRSGEFITKSDPVRPLISSVPMKEDQALFLVSRVEETASQDNGQLGENTRSEVITADNIDSFGVFAGYASENGSEAYVANYMDNVEVTRENNWTPEKEYLWPGNGSLHFNAYSPFFSNDISDEGITGISYKKGNLVLSYKTPLETSDQKELLYASPVDASASPCNLVFNHALATIRFAAGAELVPCKIKSITITGIDSKGSLNIETGEWSSLSEETQFSVDPETLLTADTGSQYVAPGTPIISEENSFMFIPQTADDNVSVSILVDLDGKETTLTASLASQEWMAGKTYTYRISGNPAADSLTLDVTGDFQAEYTGSELNFNVKSNYSDGSSLTDVKWIAEFVDKDGNVIPRPDWITDFTTSGLGDTEGIIKTQMQDIEFLNITPQTRKLQSATNINTSSGHIPYNLSSESGATAVENTANTYVVNSPGQYCFPLVYGNGIKNGAVNTASYTASTHRAHTLKTFTNHLGNALTSPYIYNNSGCTPKDAVLIWEDELNLIRNARLSSDGKSVIFDVPENTIRQGNALIAVRDNNENVMWSWQIWVTDFNPASDLVDIPVSGKNYSLWTENLGNVVGGDKTRFPECSVYVRFTQTDVPEGMEPLTKTVTVNQTGVTITTPDCNTFYQWGRKDPMMSSVKQWYNASHKEITVLPTVDATTIASSDLVKSFILSPQIFFTGSHSSTDPVDYPYINLWNVNYNNSNVKSIYDPSPAGYVVPYDQPLSFLQQYAGNSDGQYENTNVSTSWSDSTDSSKRSGFYVTVNSTGALLFFPPFGYRASSTGQLNEGSAEFWYSHAISTKSAGDMSINLNNDIVLLHNVTNPPLHAFSIRPIKE